MKCAPAFAIGRMDMNQPPTATAFQRLRDFITRTMQMSHIYQPVMLRTLLDRGGHASREEIARAILNEDRSQLDYYKEIVREMPGRVLSGRGIVARDGASYRLTDDLLHLTDAERQE